ncbi:MAG: 6-bladed beta-propeller [Bacteroidales bacterium]
MHGILVALFFSMSLLRVDAPAASAQSDSTDAFRIQWEGEYPPATGVTNRRLSRFLTGLLLGDRTEGMRQPFNLWVKGDGDLVAVDQTTGSLWILSRDGRSEQARDKDGSRNSLVGICQGPGGHLLITDPEGGQILRLDGKKLIPVWDSLTLRRPTGIAWLPSRSEIWVCETGAHCIAVLDAQGRLLKHIGTRGNGPGAFNYPTFLCWDGMGRVYVVDSMNFRIQVFSATGEFESCFGAQGDGSGDMARPKGVATDSRGHIYVVDALFHGVQVFDPEGAFLTAFGGMGQGHGEFWLPSGIQIDARDHIFVADTYNGRIQEFSLQKQTLPE